MITFAQGGYGGSTGGGGGSGYTGGGGGTLDFLSGDESYDFGAGGGGSGYLAFSRVSFINAVTPVHGAGFITIAYDVPRLQVTTNPVVNGNVGQAYSWNPIAVSGGSPGFTYDVASGALPAGLSLSASTGLISGTATTAGPVSVSVRVTDAVGQTSTAALQFSIGTLSITAPSQAATGGSVSLSGSGFDAGDYDVLLDGATPAIGTARAAVTGALTFTGTVPTSVAAGAHAIGVFRAGIRVATANVTVVTQLGAVASTAPSAFQGQMFSWTPVTASGGTSPLGYSVTGTLPAGLALDTVTGLISGTPTNASPLMVPFSVTVNDSSVTPQSASIALLLTVGSLSITAPGTATDGSAITITGAGFEQGDYTVELHSAPVVLGTVYVDASGALSITAAIPASTEPGAHQLQIIRNGIVVAATGITVTAIPTALASTGTDSEGGWLAALLLLAAGVALVTARTVRRRLS